LIKALEAYDGTLVIPQGLEQIPESACAGRDDIERIILPQTVYSIGPEAFAECTELKEIVFPNSFLHVSAASFLNCTALSRVTLSRDLQSINEGAFLGCTSLKTIVLPDTLQSIGEMAFWNSGLEEIAIPVNVQTIGENAFWDCADLHRIDILGADTHIGSNAFGNCPMLKEGFVAPGYPDDDSPPAQLLFTLLWCSCPQRHTAAVSEQAEAFIRRQEALIMEQIIKNRNVPGVLADGDSLPSAVVGKGDAVLADDNLIGLAHVVLHDLVVDGFLRLRWRRSLRRRRFRRRTRNGRRGPSAARAKGENHGQRESQCNQFFHIVPLF